MTGPEHYQEAEASLTAARRESDRGSHEDAAFWLQEGQVHATLALAAATGTNSEDRYEVMAWQKVAGVEHA